MTRQVIVKFEAVEIERDFLDNMTPHALAIGRYEVVPFAEALRMQSDLGWFDKLHDPLPQNESELASRVYEAKQHKVASLQIEGFIVVEEGGDFLQTAKNCANTWATDTYPNPLYRKALEEPESLEPELHYWNWAALLHVPQRLFHQA